MTELSTLLEVFVNGLKGYHQRHPKRAKFLLLLVAFYFYRYLKRKLFGNKSFKDKVVLVTGGCNGIGKLMAEEFRKRGARVAVWDINDDAIEKTRAEGLFAAFKCDVTKRQEVLEVAEKVRMELGEVDVLVNNAGIVSGDYITQLKERNIRRTFDVNVIAHFWTCQAFLPAMLEKNSGHVVTIASMAGYCGVSQCVDYCASKFAARGFDESLRRELQNLGKTGVKTTCVNPYLISTGMFKGSKSTAGLMKLFCAELDPLWVAQTTVQAVADDEEEVCLPRRLGHINNYLQPLMPVWMQDILAPLSLNMDQFVGRH